MISEIEQLSLSNIFRLNHNSSVKFVWNSFNYRLGIHFSYIAFKIAYLSGRADGH